MRAACREDGVRTAAFRQCELERGAERVIAWIPAHLAVPGLCLDLRFGEAPKERQDDFEPPEGLPELSGWTVLRSWPREERLCVSPQWWM